MKLTKNPTSARHSNGYRSGLEQKVAQNLLEKGVSFHYEDQVIHYVKPEKIARYTPDFVLENGIVIETKGRFLTADRQKHLLVKAQHPDIDIRFVFSRSKERISKKSKTSYAAWCEKNGFLYADESIPESWLKE
ncbi:endonuclease I [uncultured Caudovirales phage]|uniref:Endonuclease I n=1 Tax=uncultured Caudovirales phage TaxID=2100421 RepID=A0A6J5KTX9_9CAUD|nr:endonuclease I [uncultured Caudovirales phage]